MSSTSCSGTSIPGRVGMGLFFMHYNWCRKHASLRGKTPAMAHGLANEVWTVKDLLRNVMGA